MAALPGEKFSGIKISNISEKGLQHLIQNGTRPFSIEFILKAEKVQFTSNLEMVNRQVCFFSMPQYIESLERRRNARYLIGENLRAFLSFESMQGDPLDHASQPLFESAREMASMIPVVDISMGGVGLYFRFPAVHRLLDSTKSLESASLWLPMNSPSSMDVAIRWSRRVSEEIKEDDGGSRLIKATRVGVQFMNPSEQQLQGIQIFLQRLSQADAI